ncbi:MAG: adenosine kinase [Thermomicrobiales bacterium]|jgi:adenosine kinase|nr:adenosine kinase [Thermomicrobiales bacterium]
MAQAPTTDAPPVVISASIAYDHLMAFGGSFADHIIPEKTHVISISFLVDSLRKQRGGVGGNIAYSLALLGTRSTLVGAVGSDFGPYRAAFEELGVDLSGVIEDESRLTASAFMMADRKDNQIASFFPGPSDLAAGIDVLPYGDRAAYAIVGATDPEAMRRHATQFGAASCKLIYDPAFQIIILSGDDLKAGIDQSWAVIGNDYEFAMIERKTGWTLDDITERVELVAVTYGEQGSELRTGGRCVRCPAASADVVRDPTGAGDAYRAGLVKGLLLGAELDVVGRLAGLAATYAVELVGTQEHSYSPESFVARFDRSFPDYAGALKVADLTPARPAQPLSYARA